MKTIPLTESEIDHIREMYEQELEKLSKRSNEIKSLLKKFEGSTESDKISEETETQSSAKKKKIESNKEAANDEVKKVSEKAELKGEKKVSSVTSRPAKVNRDSKPKDSTDIAVNGKKEKKQVNGNTPAMEVVKGKKGRKRSEDSQRSILNNMILQILETKSKALTSREIIEEIMKIQDIPSGDFNKARTIVAGGLSDLKNKSKRLHTIPVPGQRGELYGLPQWFDNAGNLIDKFNG